MLEYFEKKHTNRALFNVIIHTEPKVTTAYKEAVGSLDEVAAEIGDWLKAKVPALEGPYQSRPFVKYVLRQIVLTGASSL